MKKTSFEKLDSQQQDQLRKLKSASLAAAAKAEGIDLEKDKPNSLEHDDVLSNLGGKKL